MELPEERIFPCVQDCVKINKKKRNDIPYDSENESFIVVGLWNNISVNKCQFETQLQK